MESEPEVIINILRSTTPETNTQSAVNRCHVAADEIERLYRLVGELLPFMVEDCVQGAQIGPRPQDASCEPDCEDCLWFKSSMVWLERINQGEFLDWSLTRTPLEDTHTETAEVDNTRVDNKVGGKVSGEVESVPENGVSIEDLNVVADPDVPFSETVEKIKNTFLKLRQPQNTDGIFNEESLREAITQKWGPYGAHADVYNHILEKSSALKSNLRETIGQGENLARTLAETLSENMDKLDAKTIASLRDSLKKWDEQTGDK